MMKKKVKTQIWKLKMVKKNKKKKKKKKNQRKNGMKIMLFILQIFQ